MSVKHALGKKASKQKAKKPKRNINTDSQDLGRLQVYADMLPRVGIMSLYNSKAKLQDLETMVQHPLKTKDPTAIETVSKAPSGLVTDHRVPKSSKVSNTQYCTIMVGSIHCVGAYEQLVFMRR